jgi:hypothetical protein
VKARIVRLLVLGLVIPLTVYSLLSALFISWGHMIVGAVAFVIVVLCLFLSGREARQAGFREARWKRWLFVSCSFSLLGALILLVLSARTTGVCDTNGLPIFAARDHFLLTNHGFKTEVSRLRFLLVGTSSVVSWHSLILLAGLWCLFPPTRSLRATSAAASARRG